ncbi:MAG: diacylglycerol kinase family protein [Patescibacteria group bacterium]|jgi:diacylglycerol kinase family enzyme
MFYYIYDIFLADKKYSPLLYRIEARLMDLGINGRTEKLTILKSLKEVMGDAVRKGADTIVAVGDDATISKIISLLPDLKVTLGIIPIGKNNKIARILGIPENELACDTISARITERIDLGKANNQYFISSLEIPAQKELIMDCGSYRISPTSENDLVSICNFDTLLSNDSKRASVCNPKDGILEAIVSSSHKNSGFFGNIFKKEYSPDSVFPFKKIKLKCSKECLPIIADGQTTIKTPVTVEVLPKKLKIIVGKNRMF